MNSCRFRLRITFMVLVSCILLGEFSKPAFAQLDERRQGQEKTEPAYLIVPTVANIPGFGSFYGLLASKFNNFNTEADAHIYKLYGDIAGQGVGVTSIPTGYNPLSFNILLNDFNKVTYQYYRLGMAASPEDVQNIALTSYKLYLIQMNLNFFDKRLQVHGSFNQQSSYQANVLNKDRERVTSQGRPIFLGYGRSLGTIVDLTDDRTDPRSGWQLEMQYYDPPIVDPTSSKFYVMDYNANYYIPIFTYSTWVTNLYRSDAVVRKTGETNEQNIRNELGYSCSTKAATGHEKECQKFEDQRTIDLGERNRHGIATTLGGTQRMRSYPTNRFLAAHAAFIGTEFRWNLTEEYSPFDIILAKGVRTGIQLAVFAERGGVGTLATEVFSDMRNSIGGGIRFLVSSGFVIRADYAVGDEGGQPTLFVDYPFRVF